MFSFIYMLCYFYKIGIGLLRKLYRHSSFVTETDTDTELKLHTEYHYSSLTLTLTLTLTWSSMHSTITHHCHWHWHWHWHCMELQVTDTGRGRAPGYTDWGRRTVFPSPWPVTSSVHTVQNLPLPMIWENLRADTTRSQRLTTVSGLA